MTLVIPWSPAPQWVIFRTKNFAILLSTSPVQAGANQTTLVMVSVDKSVTRILTHLELEKIDPQSP